MVFGQQNAWETGSTWWNIRLENLTTVTQVLLESVAPTERDINTANSCLMEFVELSKELGPQWKARVFGSVASGFHTRCSDLDITFVQTADLNDQVSASDSLAQLLPAVQRNPLFEVIEVISGARIPILKCRFDNKLDVDLTFKNTDPFPNTQLLRAYAKLSSTVRELVTLVKLWAKAEGVCGAPGGHLSSYSFTLMMLYFLQVDPLVKMPCFPTNHFVGEGNLPPAANISWQCPLPLPVLLARFFEFYATQYCWGYEVISVRVGQRIFASDPVYSQLSASDNSPIPHIEDPFLLNRNLNCVLGWDQNHMLRKKMSSAIGLLQLGSAPFGFLTALCQTMEPKMVQKIQASTAEDIKNSKNLASTSDDTWGANNPQSGTNESKSPSARTTDIQSEIKPSARSLAPFSRDREHTRNPKNNGIGPAIPASKGKLGHKKSLAWPIELGRTPSPKGLLEKSPGPDEGPMPCPLTTRTLSV